MTPLTYDGDPGLAHRLRAVLGKHHPVAGVGVVTARGTTTATIGTDLGADWEIGSVSKGITGMLYADAVERGEVTPDTSVGSLLPLDSAAVSALTLKALATHRGGLPRTPRAGHPWRKSWALVRHGTNPYGLSLAQTLDLASSIVPGRPRPRYSNIGFQLLGHAVAAAAGMSYDRLVDHRIVQPLGLTDTYVPATPEDLRPSALIGSSRRGTSRQPWVGEDIGPAGAVRSSVTDLTILMRSLMDSTAPGAQSMERVASFGGAGDIGAGWLISAWRKGVTLTWHNGGTGGFRSWLGMQRDSGVGVVVLSATARSVDRYGLRLMDEYLAQES